MRSLKVLLFATETQINLLSFNNQETLAFKVLYEIKPQAKVTHLKVYNDLILIALQGGILECYKVAVSD
jgi:hypothetical protein